MSPDAYFCSFVLVSKHLPNPHVSDLPWLSSTILDESTKYDSISLKILAYIAQQPPNLGPLHRSWSPKRTVQDTQVGSSKRRHQLRTTTQQIAPNQRPYLPTQESSQESLPQQKRSLDSLRETMQPSLASGTYDSSSFTLRNQEDSTSPNLAIVQNSLPQLQLRVFSFHEVE